jgi:DNA gyrase subunit A
MPDLRAQRLTARGRDKISAVLEKLAPEIAKYLEILSSREKLFGIIKDEKLTAKELYGALRRMQILDANRDVEDEDRVAREDMVVAVSQAGYIKRVPLSSYRLFVANTHAPVLFFSSLEAYKEKDLAGSGSAASGRQSRVARR